MKKSHSHRIKAQKPATGMRRFFSRANVDRYRKLASGAADEAEKHQLLIDLAEEMNAFRREARLAALNRPTSFGTSIGSQVGHQL